MTPAAGPRGLVVSAPASGSGKTTVTLGLLAALRARGVAVASAKSGPDYIDPAFHASATGRPCVTLDAWAAAPAQLRGRAWQALGAELAAGPRIAPPDPATLPSDEAASVLVVEGAMGLFDGADDGSAAGRGGTADVAAALGLPVILVLDCARMGQGAAAIAAGLAGFRADVRVAGAILNRVGSARHDAMLRRAVETVMPVLGSLGRRDALALPSRHLGLVQAGEHDDLAAFIARAGAWVAEGVDLDALLDAAGPLARGAPTRSLPPPGQRIALARDTAFAFAYPHQLAGWRASGAEIAPFSPLADEGPDPSADAVFLPGGYPELHAGRLAAAAAFRSGMEAARASGAAIHGECGGYMALGAGLVDAAGARHRMLGFLDLETSFEARHRTLGYRRLVPLAGPPGPLMAHEFHYATTLRAEGAPLFHAEDAAGRDLGEMGLVAGRVSGSFAHVIEPG